MRRLDLRSPRTPDRTRAKNSAHDRRQCSLRREQCVSCREQCRDCRRRARFAWQVSILSIARGLDGRSSPAFRLSFTVNHAHLVPEGIAGFVEALDIERVEEVRLADCFRNGDEVHLSPGQGDIDFADMFRRVEGKGFRGHYMNAFGSLDDMLEGRDDLVRLAAAAGLSAD